MHGLHGEKGQDMWPALPELPSVAQIANSSASKSCTKGGRKLSVGDCALFQAGNAPPFIGILRKLTQDKDTTKLGVNWLYRPADVKLAKGGPLEAAPNEIFYSFHKDEISAASLLHPCKVAFLRKGVELLPGVSSFVCRRVYDTANKCLWWLTDRDYTDEHQDEVDLLLERTKLEMQAAVQTGGPSPRALVGPTSSQQIKSSSEIVQNATYSAPNKSKKRERTDQNLEPSKRERSVKSEDGEVSPLKRDRSMKPEEIASIIDKDGGLLNPAGVERLVQLMQDRNDGARKSTDVASRRTMLVGVVAATEREDCLNRFVQLGGLSMLDDWLQEAHKGKVGDGGSPKEGDKSVEELLLTLLKALDKLPVDLEALKTCSVGKSVNNLRSHKNLEIQKKARKLVDIWKKRVDAEMKLSGEVKPGSNHGIWSYKQNSPDLLHSHMLKSGGPTEVAVKSSGAFAGSAKPMPNGANSAEGISKPTAVSAGKISNMLTSATLPTVKREESSTKLSTGAVPLDSSLSAKDEKSISSFQSQSNGQTWGNGSQGKTVSSSWKDDVKNASMGGAVSSKPLGAGSRHHGLAGKGLLGAGLTGGSKEMLSGKPLVWSRSSAAEKVATSSPVLTEKGTTEGVRESKLIVRIPNPGRSPARMSGGSFEQPVAGSRVLSPNGPERSSSISLDTPDVKNRVQNGNLTSPEVNSEVKCGGSVRPSPGEDERDKFCNAPSDGLADGESRVEDPTRMEPERCMKESHEQNGSANATVGPALRSGLSEPGAESDDNMKGDLAVGVTKSTEGIASEATAMEVDDLGISLLASVAASEIRRTSVSINERSQPEDPSVDQGRASRVSSDTTTHLKEAAENQQTVKDSGECKGQVDLKVKQDAVGIIVKCREERIAEQVGESNGGKAADLDSKKECQQEGPNVNEDGVSKDTERGHFTPQESSRHLESPGGLGMMKAPLDRKGEDNQMDDGETESTLPSVSPLPFGKDLKSEISISCQDGRKKETSDDKKSEAPGKGMELCNGYSSSASDPNQPIGSGDSESKQDDFKEAADAGQSFGRRGSDNEGQLKLELPGLIPQEDVLEVARQVEKEVEQMERYGKSASEKEIQDAKSPGFKGSDTREVSHVETGREHRWKSSTSLERGKDDDNRKRNTLDSYHAWEEAIERMDHNSAVRSTGEAEIDISRSVAGSADRKGSVSVAEAVEAALEGAQELKRRVMDGRALGRVPSFHSSQMLGLPNLASSASPGGSSPSVSKHTARSLPAGEPTTPEQATETTGPNDGVVGGSDVSERPDFDLNEGFSVEESPQDDSTTSPVAPTQLAAVSMTALASSSSLAAPIAIVTVTKGPFVLPASPMRSKSELGWKGSAATSAFRPAEPRRTPDRQPSAGDNLVAEVSTGSTTKKVRPSLDLNIDLNVVDDRTFEEAGVAASATASSMSSQGSAAGMSVQMGLPCVSVSGVTFQSDHFTSGHGALPAARPILDLNMLDDSEESGTLLDPDTRVTDAIVPAARSINSSSLQSSRRASVLLDFDLNDGPSVEDAVTDEPPALQSISSRSVGASVIPNGQVLRRGPDIVNPPPWFAANNSFKSGIPDFSASRPESPYSAAAAAAQSYLSAGAGGSPFSDLYRSNVTLPSGSALAFPSGAQAGYPYQGFPVPSGYPFTSSGATYSINNSAPYLDSVGSVSFPIASSGTVTSHLARPSYLMGLPEVGPHENGWSTRPSLDLNAGPESGDGDGGREDGMSVRQSPMLGGQPSFEQMRALRQAVNAAGHLGAPPLKRKEPDTGWELNRSGGFKQQAWR